MTGNKVFVVDDDESACSYVRHLLQAKGYEVDSAYCGEDAIGQLSLGYRPDIMLVDLLMPGVDGLEVLEYSRRAVSAVPVVILTGVGQAKTVVKAIRMGAADYLTKPFEDDELELAIENALEKEQLRSDGAGIATLPDANGMAAELVSCSPRMQRIKEMAQHVADADVPVLLLGESGVGKEVVARYIHTHSARREKAFVKVNCAALPNDLLESEMFGYEKGAFTGALTDKPGKFEMAGDGTILLDEIGEMTPALQAKLLHVLQDGEYMRLGGKKPERAEARVIAATNRNLREAVAQGQFREDLYFRLGVIDIEIPALRDRLEDIPSLSRFFFQRYRQKYKSTVQVLPPALIDAFCRYDWPGNVRQLENAVRRFLILPELDAVLPDLAWPATGSANGEAAAHPSLKALSAQAAEEAERQAVLRALDATNWNRKQAAKELGICYKALLNKLKRWELTRPVPSMQRRLI